MILDGESGDEMMENDEKTSPMSKIKNKRRSKRKRHAKIMEHEVAVGSDVEEDDIHEVEDNDDEEDEVRSRYKPSIAGEIDELEHGVEVDDERAGDEDDEDIIDVDEEDGEPRLSKRGALKHEAKTRSTF